MSMHPPTTPPNTGRAITIGETNRYVRTNSNKEDFQKMTTHLKAKLAERGYKPSMAKANIEESNFSDRTAKLAPRRTNPSKYPLVFVTKYSDRITEIREVLNRNWDNLTKHPSLQQIFRERPQIAYKSNPSLRNKLVQVRLPPIERDTTNTKGDSPATNQSQPATSISMVHQHSPIRTYHSTRVKNHPQ